MTYYSVLFNLESLLTPSAPTHFTTWIIKYTRDFLSEVIYRATLPYTAVRASTKKICQLAKLKMKSAENLYQTETEASLLKGFTGVETIKDTVFFAHESKTTHSVTFEAAGRYNSRCRIHVNLSRKFRRQRRVQTVRSLTTFSKRQICLSIPRTVTISGDKQSPKTPRVGNNSAK